MSEYRELLGELRMSKSELGRRLGVREDTACRWGDEPPAYALAYLRLLAEVRRFVKRAEGV